jgi:hypothetical protein
MENIERARFLLSLASVSITALIVGLTTSMLA